MSELTENLKRIAATNQRLGDFMAGMEYGKTMAEVDAYYEAILKEIQELQERFKGNGNRGISKT